MKSPEGVGPHSLWTTHCPFPTVKVSSCATSRLYITLAPGTLFHLVTTPYVPPARNICIPNLICPTGRNPFSLVKKGCFWLVCITSLVLVAGLPCCAGLLVVSVRSTRSWSWLIHTCRMGSSSMCCVWGL